MAETPDNTSKPKLRNNSFSVFSCFGFPTQDKKKKRKQEVSLVDLKKGQWRISWSRLKQNKSELSEKVNCCKQVHAEDAIVRKSQVSLTGEIREPKERLGSSLQDKSKSLKKKQKSTHGRGLECSKSSVKRNSSIVEASAKKEKENEETDLRENEVVKPIQKAPTLSKISSFTSQIRKKRVTIEGEKEKPQGEKLIAKSESIYGFSIIMVTLIIMLIWGKLCAIACTSMWLYLIPRLKSLKEPGVSINSAESGSKQKEFDVINEANKKKVVFEGFLERKHRNASRTLYSIQDKGLDRSG